MLTPIIQWLDAGFQKLIFIPAIFLILYSFGVLKKGTARIHLLHKLCAVLVAAFLIRCFLAQFIFTPVNYHRFVDQGYFPLVRALFYD